MGAFLFWNFVQRRDASVLWSGVGVDQACLTNQLTSQSISAGAIPKNASQLTLEHELVPITRPFLPWFTHP
jgi:hypothetical protein